MNLQALADRLKAKGAECGLAAVGIAPAGVSDHATFLKEWLAAGRAGTMAWMERTAEDRADLSRRFPWVRAAVVAAAPYLPYKDDRHRQPGLLPHVARYAVGRDYHRVLGVRLRALADFLISEAPGARVRVYTDTGPVLERELAARAGLGWFGKNANLIGPGGDSWILLGQILTDLDLPADGPVADRCGTCTACLDACPTGAILEPYLVDSNRCISYLTIELRGRIPTARRADLGDWVFGCDVCQEVCPWNRKVEPTRDAEFLAGAPLAEADLEALVNLDDREFRATYADTPLGRPRRQGLVRNALIVAANTGDERSLEAAAGRIADPDPVVRATAAWTLGRAGGARRRQALARALAAEEDPDVRVEIEAALDQGVKER
jgi:epoxyqueuosine reductase